jgi:hypothetical protein
MTRMSLLEAPEAQAWLEDAVIEAGDVADCRRQIERFVRRYLPRFYRQEQRTNAALVIRGHVSGLERKTCEPIARAAGVERKPIQFFVGNGKWDDEAVMTELRVHVAEELGEGINGGPRKVPAPVCGLPSPRRLQVRSDTIKEGLGIDRVGWNVGMVGGSDTHEGVEGLGLLRRQVGGIRRHLEVPIIQDSVDQTFQELRPHLAISGGDRREIRSTQASWRICIWAASRVRYIIQRVCGAKWTSRRWDCTTSG